MNNIKIHCDWDMEFDLFNEKQIELYVDKFPVDKVPDNTVRFVLLIEPEEISHSTHPAMYSMKKGYYNNLFTHNDFLLDNCPNSHLFEFGTTWIKDYKFPTKKFELSTLVGGKTYVPGHIMRHELWNRQDEINKIKTNFFLSGNNGGIPNPKNNPILGSSKSPLFDSQFHICIENIKRKHWFTEKLIDCLQTKTIPIYYGCPNIGDWFDTKGMIIVNSVNEIIDASNNLNEDSYNNLIEYVNKNFELSKKFITINDRLQEKITNLI